METKHLFRNNSPGVIGYVFYDESNKRRGGALQPGEAVWLTERDLVATAAAPKKPSDNPLENGRLTHEATEGDPAHSRNIGLPGASGAPSLTPEPAPAEEESPEEPSGEGEGGGEPEAPTADEAARAEAAKEEEAKEAAAKKKIEEAEAAEAARKAEAAKKTPAEEAAQRVGKEKADLSAKPASGGGEETATEGEAQGKQGEGKRSAGETVGGTQDALSD